MSEEGEFICLFIEGCFLTLMSLECFSLLLTVFTRERNWQLLQRMSYKGKNLGGYQTLKSTKRRGDKKIMLVVLREIFLYCKQWISNVKTPNQIW